MSNSILAVIGIIIVGIGAYLFLPMFTRVADQAAKSIADSEQSDNWEYYYDQEIAKMESKLQDFGRQREETIAESLKMNKEAETLKQRIDQSQSLLVRVAEDYKKAVAEGSDSIRIGERSMAVAGVRDQLAIWVKEKQELESQYERLAEAVRRTSEVRKRERAAFQKSEAQIAALKREKVFMKSDMKMADIENRLRELEGLSQSWTGAQDFSELERVKSVVADRLLGAQARRELLAEEDSIDRSVGLNEALRGQSVEESNAAVSAELDALLGGK